MLNSYTVEIFSDGACGERYSFASLAEAREEFERIARIPVREGTSCPWTVLTSEEGGLRTVIERRARK